MLDLAKEMKIKVDSKEVYTNPKKWWNFIINIYIV